MSPVPIPALPNRKRRGGQVLAVAAVMVLLAVALLLSRAARAEVAVLIIEESNGSILSARLDQPASPRLVLQGAGAEAATAAVRPGIRLDGSLLPLPRRTRLLVYQSVTSGVDLVEDRLWPLDSLPATVQTGAVVKPRPGGAGEGGKVGLIQNERRLGPAVVEVLGLTRQGTLQLRLRGADVTLKPGEQWVEGRTVQAGVEHSIPAGAWDEEVKAALEGAAPLTIVRVSYLGLVPRSRISPLP